MHSPLPLAPPAGYSPYIPLGPVPTGALSDMVHADVLLFGLSSLPIAAAWLGDHQLLLGPAADHPACRAQLLCTRLLYKFSLRLPPTLQPFMSLVGRTKHASLGARHRHHEIPGKIPSLPVDGQGPPPTTRQPLAATGRRQLASAKVVGRGTSRCARYALALYGGVSSLHHSGAGFGVHAFDQPATGSMLHSTVNISHSAAGLRRHLLGSHNGGRGAWDVFIHSWSTASERWLRDLYDPVRAQ